MFTSFYRRYIFWTEMGNRIAIGRTHMDGTSKTYIVTTGIKFPNGLAIDYSCKVPNLALIQIIKMYYFDKFILYIYFPLYLLTPLCFSKPFVLDRFANKHDRIFRP